MIKFTFLSENKTESSSCTGEHGLSVYIETHGKKILFDFGASDLFYKNAVNLGIDLSKVDMAVVSHGHYDHTGGIPQFAEINKDAPIYIHKNAFRQTYGMENGKLEKVGSGIRFPKDQFDHRWALTDGLTRISDEIVISGTIPVPDDGKPIETFYMKEADGSLRADDMSHEQFLAIRDTKGVFLFSGCSHRGVLPAVNYCKEIFPDTPIYMLIAGMHLYHASSDETEKMVGELRDLGINKVMPVHCTGLKAITAIKNSMGEDCILATAGERYEYS